MYTASPPPPNFPSNQRQTLLPQTLLFRFLVEINLLLGVWYLYWRVTQSVNVQALWLAMPLLLAELYSYGGSVLFLGGLWRPLVRQIRSLDQLRPPLPPEDWPTVDVFIACYNEPPELVQATAEAALAMDYPVEKLNVYILDDGNSPAMRAMAEQLGLIDLQSPALQQSISRISQVRSQLQTQHTQLEALLNDVLHAERYLTQQGQPEKNTPLACSLESTALQQQYQAMMQGLGSLYQAILLTHPQFTTVSDYLRAELRTLDEAIHTQELALTQLSRCRYLARPKPEGRPHHAKAGNINHALFSGETHGEFILTLDADHIPVPHFLKRVLPYFYTYNRFRGAYDSNTIAFVQTPQDFYNIPPGDPFGHRAHLFYGPIQQGKDGVGAAFYTGTNAVLRREALINVGLQYFSQMFATNAQHLDEFELVGGMSSNSITEDMNTAMRLHAAGWQSVYHNELLAKGLAPDDLSSTLKQRLRWAQGTIQVLTRENPLTKPGLSFWQRWQYFQTMYSYFSGFFNLIYIACPIVYLFFEIAPIRSYGPNFWIHFLPAFLVNRLTFAVLTWHIPAGETWRSEQYAVAYFPLNIQAVWSVLSGRPVKFQVTPKQRQAGIYFQLIWPQLTAALLIVFGLGWTGWRWVMGTLSTPWIALINAGWAIYTLALLWVVIHAAMWKPAIATESASSKP